MNDCSPFTLAFQSLFPPRSLPPSRTWRSIVAAMEEIRGQRFSWLPVDKSEVAFRERARATIEKSPSLVAWVESDSCMVSPQSWPPDLLPAFAHRMIPTPYEMANTNIKVYRSKGPNQVTPAMLGPLVLYVLGMDVPTIAEVHSCGEKMIAHHFWLGAKTITALPSFKVWASATDFSKAHIPGHVLFPSLRAKLAFFRMLERNPFLANRANTLSLVESRSYLTYLIYNSPKKPRLSPGCFLARTKEAHRGQPKKEKAPSWSSESSNIWASGD